jgi:hypothetical protein
VKNKGEFEDFTNLAGRLLHVPHSEVKEKLDTEKKAKKRKKSKVSSASREAGGKV